MTETVTTNTLEQLHVSREDVLHFFQNIPEYGLGFHGVRDAQKSIPGIMRKGLQPNLSSLYSYIIAPHADPDKSLAGEIKQEDAEALALRLVKGIGLAVGVGIMDEWHTQPTALVFFDYPKLPNNIYEHENSPFPSASSDVPQSNIRHIFVRQTKESKDSFARRVVRLLLQAKEPIIEEVRD